MDFLKNFMFDDCAYEVRIIEQDGKPLFRAGDVGKVLGLSNVPHAIRDFDDDESTIVKSDTAFGPKMVNFLTEVGAYRLVMRSNKPIARPFQKWVCSVIATIHETGKYDAVILAKEAELKEAMHSAEAAVARDFKAKEELRMHNMFTEAHEGCSVVYLGKICRKGDATLVKIGSTSTLKQRCKTLTREYGGSFTVFEVFPVSRNLEFERFMQLHHKLKKHRYREDIVDGKKSTEVFLLDDDTISLLVNIGRKNAPRFVKGKVHEELLHLHAKVDALADAMGVELPEKDSAPSGLAEHDTGEAGEKAIGNKIQRYSADGKTLLHTYSQLCKATRDTTLPESVSASSLRNAIYDGCAYKGFRWAYLNRDLPDDTVQELKETTPSKKYKTGLIAELSADKASVLKVYRNRSTVAEGLGYQSVTSFFTQMEAGNAVGKAGLYYQPWDELSNELRMSYDGDLPNAKQNHATEIEQLDPVTGAVVARHGSQEHVCAKIAVSLRTLQSAINGDLVLREFKWRVAV
ncbi:BRO family, N-terminal domain-containing protein [Tribonema minus]|uniref:BRO family, N-terminal domain-containing protein n=1 Tax=Tribonema minus TaxID=303371 RepID=A0A835Z9N5_9STRA|nr:BRO family, N-terminal domain-containing protein [Tribonema minus]